MVWHGGGLRYNKAAQLTPNFIVSIDLCPGILPYRLALTGTTFAGHGATDGCRYVFSRASVRRILRSVVTSASLTQGVTATGSR